MPNIFEVLMNTKEPVISEEAAEFLRENSKSINPSDQAKYLSLLRQAENENYIHAQQVIDLFNLNKTSVFIHAWFKEMATIWEKRFGKDSFAGEEIFSAAMMFFQKMTNADNEDLQAKINQLGIIIGSIGSPGSMTMYCLNIIESAAKAVTIPEAKATKEEEVENLDNFWAVYSKENKMQEIMQTISDEADQVLKNDENRQLQENEELDTLFFHYQNYLAEKIYSELSKKDRTSLGIPEIPKILISSATIQPVLEDERERNIFSVSTSNSNLKTYIGRFEAIEIARNELKNEKNSLSARFNITRKVFKDNVDLFQEEKDGLGKRILKAIIKKLTFGKVDLTSRNKMYRKQVRTLFNKTDKQIALTSENLDGKQAGNKQRKP